MSDDRMNIVSDPEQDAPGEPEVMGEDDSSDGEWEEETTYVVLDLGTDVSEKSVKEAAAVHGGVSIIDLDTPTPYLRVGNMTFKGVLDRTLGTNLIFATSAHDESRPKRPPKGPLPLSVDPNRPDINMTYMGQSTTIAKFTRVVLQPKKKTTETSTGDNISTMTTM